MAPAGQSRPPVGPKTFANKSVGKQLVQKRTSL